MTNHRLAGMTMIELLATVTIIGLLSIFAVPSLQALQGRESLLSAQHQVQSALYRMQQLAIAQPEYPTEIRDYDIVGYGLYFQPVSDTAGVRFPDGSGCGIVTNPPRDFVAVVKYVRARTGNADIRPVLNATDSQNSHCPLSPRDYPNDFYIFPSHITMSALQSSSDGNQPFPWLLPVPLEATGNQYGDLPILDWHNPLPTTASTATLVLANSHVHVQGQQLCRSLTFAKTTNSIDMSSKILDKC